MLTITLINLTAGKITIGSVTVPPSGSVNVIEINGDMLVAKQQRLIDIIVEGSEDSTDPDDPSIDPLPGDFAPLFSPFFMGIPEAPTAESGNKTLQIATTEFVQDAIAGAIMIQPDPFTKQLDFVTDETLYKGEAEAGSGLDEAKWRISLIQITDDDASTTWAGGTTAFDKVWNNRTSYAYL
jgi:hypothetical protein